VLSTDYIDIVLVCFAPNFEDELEEFGNTVLTEKIHQLKKRIEETDAYVVGLLFDPINPYKKRKVLYDYRLIVREWIIDAQRVMVFCKIFQRKEESDYGEFLASRRLPDQAALQEAARSYRRSALEQVVIGIPKVPDAMHEWLQPLRELQVGYTDSEFFIHELRNWIKDVKEVFLDTNLGLQLLHQVVSSIVDESLIGQLADRSTGTVYVQSKTGCHVIWGLHDGRTICLLSATVALPSESDKARCAAMLNNPNYKAEVRKAYWSLTAADPELWSAIELNNEGNLFLSQEELSLLDRLSGPKIRVNSPDDNSRNTLPALISGRAGTGKSTMLAYIFASMLVKMAIGNLEGRPVYVTYNQELLDNARKTVRGLLRSNSIFRRKIDDLKLKDPDVVSRLEKAISRLEKDYVLSYRDLLRDFLAPEERDAFNEIDRVEFSQFKTAYQGSKNNLEPFENYEFRQHTSPERAFFIIRQFIKGALGDAEPGSDSVQEVKESHEELTESDQLGVSSDEVVKVFKTVYRGWYEGQLKKSRLWDDQDLVLAATKALERTGDTRPKIAAIVCDESQDFTPREIRFLVRSCDLLRYDLRELKLDYPTIPIVLAGDALQTLSPTGFRWSAVGAILYEEIWAACNIDGLRPENITLETNYRSADGIVKFCNYIQLVRKEMFPKREDSREIKPQHAWDATASTPPLFFKVGWNITEDEVREIAESRVMLLPCEESGERSYIQSDPTLAPLLEGREILPYAMSSSKAKGREFPQVFIYNFGTHYESEGFNMKVAEGHSTDFAREFFFNKLYVAASRAGQSLMIIENNAGNTRPHLWQNLVSSGITGDANQKSLDNSDHPFAGQVVLAREGSKKDWSDAPAVVTPEGARGLLKSGQSDSDYETLLRAVMWFETLGPEFRAEADQARAWAFKVQNKFAEAVSLFVRAGHPKEAWITALEGMLWDDALRLQTSYTDAPDYEIALATMMKSDQGNIESVQAFCWAIARAIASDRFEQRRFRTRVWAQVIDEIKRRIASLVGDSFQDPDPIPSALNIEEIRDALKGAAYGSNSISALRAEVGDLYFMERQWNGAFNEYGACSSLSNAQHNRKIYAQAQTQGFPAGLHLLANARLTVAIVVAWEAAGSPVDAEWYQFVERALVEQRDHLRRLEFALAMNNIPHAMTSLNASEVAGSPLLDVMRQKFVKLSATQLDSYNHIQTVIEAIGDVDRVLRNQMIEVVVIEALKQWESPADYGLNFQPFEFKSSDGVPLIAKNVMYHILQKYDRKTGTKVLDPRWHGRALEFANDWKAAYTLYWEYVEGYASRDVKEFCRAGFMRAANRFGDTAGAARGRPGFSTEDREIADSELKKGASWGLVSKEKASTRRKNLYDDDLCRDRLFPLVDIPPLTEQGGEEYEDAGSFHDFTWHTRNRKTQLSFYTEDGFLSWMIDPSSGGSVSEASGPDVRRRADGQFQIDREGWRIEVKFGRDETRVTIGARRVEGLSDDKEGRYVFHLRS